MNTRGTYPASSNSQPILPSVFRSAASDQMNTCTVTRLPGTPSTPIISKCPGRHPPRASGIMCELHTLAKDTNTIVPYSTTAGLTASRAADISASGFACLQRAVLRGASKTDQTSSMMAYHV